MQRKKSTSLAEKKGGGKGKALTYYSRRSLASPEKRRGRYYRGRVGKTD